MRRDKRIDVVASTEQKKYYACRQEDFQWGIQCADFENNQKKPNAVLERPDMALALPIGDGDGHKTY